MASRASRSTTSGSSIPLPAALVPPGRAARRARWMRRAVAVTVLALLILPPLAWAWIGRGTTPADGVFTYPSDPPWSDARGIAVADVLDPSAVTAADGSTGCAIQADDWVTAINGVPLAAWARGEAGRPAPQSGTTAVYTIDRPGSDATCTARVELRDFGWGAAIRQHFSVLLLAGVMWTVAAFVFLQRPRDPAARALFLIALLVPYGVTTWPLAIQAIDLTLGPRLWPFVWGEIANAMLWGATLHFAAVFPRPLPFLSGRPWRLIAVYAAPFLLHFGYIAVRDPGHLATNLLGIVLPAAVPAPDLDTWAFTLPVSVAASRVAPVMCAATLLWQYLHVRGPDERRRMQWVIYSFVVIAVIYMALLQIPSWLRNRPLIPEDVQVILFIVVPLALGAAVLRYGIFDVQIILRRSLVYGTLTAALVLVPAALTLLVAELVHAHPTGWERALAVALVVALFFQTLRTRLKRRVSRLIFGDRDDPYELVAQLGSRLQSSVAAESLLSSVAETVARALRLPYVGIELISPDRVVDVESYGERQSQVLSLPLLHQGEDVGRLLLDPGTGREPFGPADRRLVELLTQQVALAAQSVLLTGRLQRSLQRAVVAREEERRRLRRDIHDGLGPMLAATKMQLELAQQLVERDSDAAVRLLGELVKTQQAVIVDVRRLVEGLRPPVLDQLGLASALRERAATLSGFADDDQALTITVVSSPDIDPLPAAVEVAAYRVVLEALTNVARHAAATRCQVRLWRAEGLMVEVSDNGRGLPEIYRAGVGLSSMRERATELGGSCTITAGPNGGTVVRARFPILVD